MVNFDGTYGDFMSWTTTWLSVCKLMLTWDWYFEGTELILDGRL